MPISATTTPGGSVHPNPFRSPLDHPDQIRLDVSGLTAYEVDARGYLKPGVPLTKGGVLVTVGVAVYGCNIEAVKVAANNAPATLAAAPDVDITVDTMVLVNQDILEDCLGRVLTAAEIAGFGLAGSTCKLI